MALHLVGANKDPPLIRPRFFRSFSSEFNNLMKNVSNINQTLIDGWSKQYGRPVSAHEVEQINRNLSQFFSILLSWQKQFKEEGLIDEAGNIRNSDRSHKTQ